ncbi:MAG: hypothetical protein ACIARR_05090 [Phycisphaerales bacterium JB059]
MKKQTKPGIARRSTLGLLACAIALPCLMTLSGCRKGGVRSRLVSIQRTKMIEIDGPPVTRGRFTALDIENQNGSITIIASDRLSEAEIEWNIPRGDRAEIASYGIDPSDKSLWVQAEHEAGPDRSILRVTTLNAPLESGFHPRVDLTIRTPVCDGLLVRNSGGDVEIVGIRGAITVENGFAGGQGGRVEVRAVEPVVEPVRLTSSVGPVYLVLPPESRGTLDIQSASGRADFNTKFGRVTQVHPTERHWTGVWNEGGNRIELYSGEKDARVMVVERPRTHSTGQAFSFFN